jgi:hypothetical protein
MDADNFWVSAEEDTGEDRHYWCCKRCPCIDKCSKPSWRKVKARSFICEKDVRDNVYNHLVNSGKHHLDHEAATLAVEMAEIEFLSSSQGGGGVAIGASSGTPIGSAIVRCKKRPIEAEDMMNSQRLRLVMDSLDRVRELTNAADEFQERAVACVQAAGALQDEHNGEGVLHEVAQREP